MSGPYFHGGAPGLRVGGRILPPSVTGVTPSVDHLPADHPDDLIDAGRDAGMTDREIARALGIGNATVSRRPRNA